MRLLIAAATAGLVATTATIATPAHAATQPSFDCAKARSSAEKLVCADDQLAALDRETARLFGLARDGRRTTAERRAELIATQRGWIKGRDDCWKAEDRRACVLGNYLIRIKELRQGYADARGRDGEGISRGPMQVRCEGLDAPIGATFVGIEPPVAHVEWGDRSLLLTLSPSGSGARYTASYGDGEYVFWTKGDGALLEMPGRDQLTCRIGETG